jgi:hypothetical protein
MPVCVSALRRILTSLFVLASLLILSSRLICVPLRAARLSQYSAHV